MPVSFGQNVIGDASRSLESLLTAKIRVNIAGLPFPATGPAVPSVGLPNPVMPNPVMPHPGGAQWQRAADTEIATRGHPVVRRAMADPNFARLAHDDVRPLTGIEKAVNLGFPAYDDDTWWNKISHFNLINWAANGAQQVAGNKAGDAQNSYTGSEAKGFGHAIQGLAELVDADTRKRRDQVAAGKVPFVSPDNARLYDGTAASRFVAPLADALIKRGNDLESRVSKPTVVTKAGGTAGNAAPGLVALVPGGQPVAAAYFGGQGAHAVAEKARQAGTYGTPKSDRAMGVNALIQAGVSAIPVDRLAAPLIPALGGPIKQWLAGAAVKAGVAAGQATTMTVGQNALVKSMVDPKQDLLEGEGDSAGTMAFLTLLGHLAHGAAPPVVNAAAGTRARLGAVAENARASTLRTRAPEVFRRVVQAAAGKGGAKTVFVRPEPLVAAMQTPKGDSILRAMPDLVDKTREAMANDGHVAIPVEDMATHIAPTDVWDGVADHLTLSPHDTSMAEVHHDAVAAATAIQTQHEAARAGAGDTAEFDRSTQAVTDAVRGQLDQAQPFSAKDNAVRAGLLGQIYAIQASREGKTPEDIFRRVPIPSSDVGADSMYKATASPIPADSAEFQGRGEARPENADDGKSEYGAPQPVEGANNLDIDADTLDRETVEHISGMAKESRPLPDTYLSWDYQRTHAKLFSAGVARIQPSAPTGIIGRTETWVMPRSVALQAISAADGDVSALERALGVDPGYLGEAPVLVDIPSPKGYRIPTGREYGANKWWRPGGFTYPGGLPEAVIDPVQPGEYHVTPVFSKEQ